MVRIQSRGLKKSCWIIRAWRIKFTEREKAKLGSEKLNWGQLWKYCCSQKLYMFEICFINFYFSRIRSFCCLQILQAVCRHRQISCAIIHLASVLWIMTTARIVIVLMKVKTCVSLQVKCKVTVISLSNGPCFWNEVLLLTATGSWIWLMLNSPKNFIGKSNSTNDNNSRKKIVICSPWGKNRNQNLRQIPCFHCQVSLIYMCRRSNGGSLSLSGSVGVLSLLLQQSLADQKPQNLRIH